MNVRQQMEAQRTVLDRMAEEVCDLTELISEAEQMDNLIEAYEAEYTKTIS